MSLFGTLVLAACAVDPPLLAQALVLVDPNSPAHAEFVAHVRPYLDNFGVPYDVLDITTRDIDPAVGRYALIVVGHGRLDPANSWIDAEEQAALVDAVRAGSGLVTFDNDLWSAPGVPRYAFVQELFEFAYQASGAFADVTFRALPEHAPPAGATRLFPTAPPNDGRRAPREPELGWITALHEVGDSISTGPMGLARIAPPPRVAVPATAGTQPLLALATAGAGRAVQWGSIDWMRYDVLGPFYGLDDLVWRSLAWAARKPFVMRGLPPLVTMRVDDVEGPLWWIDAAVERGLRPFLGVFPDDLDAAEAAEIARRAQAGEVTASIHAWTWSDFFYWNHWAEADFRAATLQAFYAQGTAWHATHGIPISVFAVPHFSEIGVNAFDGLREWGVEFVTNLNAPSQPYGSPWLRLGPYRRDAPQQASDLPIPLAYADFLSVPGRPDLDGEFFVCSTQVRDDANYEWYPDNDVPASIGRGVRQLRRALDGLVMPMLFTHDWVIQSVAPSSWEAILDGVQAGIAAYEPEYVTLDAAGRYVRATKTSRITRAELDATTLALTVTLEGEADVETTFQVFEEDAGSVRSERVAVPVFSGSVVVARP